VIDEILANWLLEGAHNFGYEVIPAIFQFVADLFKRLLAAVERVLYGVDEWFQFRRAGNPVSQAFKSVVGVLWLGVSYVLRLLIVLFIEPIINPLKHFPMVTVAGKFTLIMGPVLNGQLAQVMSPRLAWLVAVVLVFGVPGVFGFLVWELKE